MRICTKLLVLAVEPEPDGRQLVTNSRVLEISIITEPHQYEPLGRPVKPGDTIYVVSDQMIIGEQP